MKKMFFALLCFLHLNTAFASFLPTDYSIVFVHLGRTVPSYMETAINQAALFNEKSNIFLIANHTALESFITDVPNFIPIEAEHLIQTLSHQKFLRNSTLDKEFREGFWNHAAERFLYLHDFMAQYKVNNVFHLENDNMLYADLGELLPVFRDKCRGIGATFDNDERGIAGFMYISDPSSMAKLARFMAEEVKHGHTDMEMLSLFQHTFGENVAHHLPIIMEEYVVTQPLKSLKGHTVKDSALFCNNIEEFNSIFDAAALGQYLGGPDPLNGYSAPKFINERCVFNPGLLTFEWEKDSQGRNVPYAVYRNNKYRINNLHVHCKNLEYFSSIGINSKL